MKANNENLRLGIIFVTVLILTVSIYSGAQAIKGMKANRDREKANAFFLNAHELQALCFKNILPENTSEPFVVLGIGCISSRDYVDPSNKVISILTGYPYKIGVYSDYKGGLYGGLLPPEVFQQPGEVDKEGSLYFIRFEAVSSKGLEIEMGRISGSLDGVGETFFATKNEDGDWELEGPFLSWISSNDESEQEAPANLVNSVHSA